MSDSSSAVAENPVDCTVRALWDVREAGGGRIASGVVKTWGRMLAEAVQAMARAQESYSPEEDHRVLWAREVLQAARQGKVRCQAAGDLEAMTAYLLGVDKERELSGRDLAAGGEK